MERRGRQVGGMGGGEALGSLKEKPACQLGKRRMTQRNGAGFHFFLCCKWIINVTFSRADKTKIMQFWAQHFHVFLSHASISMTFSSPYSTLS